MPFYKFIFGSSALIIVRLIQLWQPELTKVFYSAVLLTNTLSMHIFYV